jgi:capsular polysaccharide biosynthesis protein
MEIRDYLRILRRRAWIPLSLIVAMTLITGALTYLSKPTYTATTTMLVKNQGSGAGSALSFQEIATSNTVTLHVRSQLHLEKDVDSLVQQVTVTGGQNNLYRLTVTDVSADRAVSVANAYAQEAVRLYKQLAGGTVTGASAQDVQENQATYLSQYMAATNALVDFEQQHPDAVRAVAAAGVTGSSTSYTGSTAIDPGVRAEYRRLQLAEKASANAYSDFLSSVAKARVDEIVNARNIDARVVDEAAAKRITTGRYLNVIYAAALALVVGVALAFGVEYLDNSVREPEEVEQLVGWPVIGVIPRGNARTLRAAGEDP